jgi:hypothetical protein
MFNVVAVTDNQRKMTAKKNCTRVVDLLETAIVGVDKDVSVAMTTKQHGEHSASHLDPQPKPSCSVKYQNGSQQSDAKVTTITESNT